MPWSQTKSLCYNFTGINFTLLDKLSNKRIEPKDYLDDGICSWLFLRNNELKKFNKISKIIGLNKYLKL